MGIYGIWLPGNLSADPGHPEEVRPVTWGVSRVEGPRAFWAQGPSYGSCGGPAPRLEPVVRERKGRSVVTVILHIPATPEMPGPIYCADTLLRLGTKVQLKRPLCDVALYDGSTTPPSRRSLHQLDPYCNAATYWQRCEGPARLKVHRMPCQAARGVLSRFFCGEETFDPSPSPPGWGCEQRHTGPKTNIDEVHLVTCDGAAKKNRRQRLNYVWGAGQWPQTPGS